MPMTQRRALAALLIAVVGALAAWPALSGLLRARGDDAGTLLVSGNIEAHESLVAFKSVQSRIVELPFDEGQWVEKGTLLARVDAADYRQQVAIDAAGLRVRRAELASAKEALEAARKTVLADVADRTLRARSISSASGHCRVRVSRPAPSVTASTWRSTNPTPSCSAIARS